MRKMRIFVGIKTDKSLNKKFSEFRKNYKDKFPVRWITSDNLHLTLVPPWYEEDIEKVKNRLKNTDFNTPYFYLEFNKISFGPQKNRPRLIWAEGNAPKELLLLKKALEKTLGKPNEGRNYKLHLTLARFKPRDFKNFPVKMLDKKINWKMEVGKVSLFESKLFKSGALYIVLEDFSLNKDKIGY